MAKRKKPVKKKSVKKKKPVRRKKPLTSVKGQYCFRPHYDPMTQNVVNDDSVVGNMLFQMYSIDPRKQVTVEDLRDQLALVESAPDGAERSRQLVLLGAHAAFLATTIREEGDRSHEERELPFQQDVCNENGMPMEAAPEELPGG